MSKRKKAATYILDFLYVISHSGLFVLMVKGLLLLMVSVYMCQTRDSRPLEELGQYLQNLSQKDIIILNKTVIFCTLLIVIPTYVLAKKVYAAVFSAILLICILGVGNLFPEIFLWEIKSILMVPYFFLFIQLLSMIIIRIFELPSKVYTYCEVCRDAKRGAFIDEKADRWCKELELFLKETESGHDSSQSTAKVKVCLEEMKQLTDNTTFQPYTGKAVCIEEEKIKNEI